MVSKSWSLSSRTELRIRDDCRSSISFVSQNYGYVNWAAARRLVLYWEYRYTVFGDRWLLPLSDSGEGAITVRDTEILKNGWLAVIPQSSQAPCILFDNTKVEGDPVDQRLRIAFYVFSVVSGSHAAQRDGVTIIHNNIDQKILSVQSLLLVLEIVHHAMPLRVAQSVILRSSSESRGSASDIVNTKLYQTYAKCFGNSVPQMITVNNKRTCAKLLAESLAIPLSCCPVELGGEWTYDRISEWQTTIALYDTDPPASVTLLAPSRASSASEFRERAEELSKARNALYARCSYRKRKAKETELEKEVHQLEAEQSFLRSENQILESLYQQALAVIMSLSETPKSQGFPPLAATRRTRGFS